MLAIAAVRSPDASTTVQTESARPSSSLPCRQQPGAAELRNTPKQQPGAAKIKNTPLSQAVGIMKSFVSQEHTSNASPSVTPITVVGARTYAEAVITTVRRAPVPSTPNPKEPSGSPLPLQQRATQGSDSASPKKIEDKTLGQPTTAAEVTNVKWPKKGNTLTTDLTSKQRRWQNAKAASRRRRSDLRKEQDPTPPQVLMIRRDVGTAEQVSEHEMTMVVRLQADGVHVEMPGRYHRVYRVAKSGRITWLHHLISPEVDEPPPI